MFWIRNILRSMISGRGRHKEDLLRFRYQTLIYCTEFGIKAIIPCIYLKLWGFKLNISSRSYRIPRIRPKKFPLYKGAHFGSDTLSPIMQPQLHTAHCFTPNVVSSVVMNVRVTSAAAAAASHDSHERDSIHHSIVTASQDNPMKRAGDKIKEGVDRLAFLLENE